ncbi:major facilitator superfamily domain-containing protein [Mycena albidolilacea]|uniref:Major facilitator superfamily domain-containing protein n=1 Tax=Mycena albidolilacea TaxID=1033008 RepID=A0AAD7AQH5_9AGAR|nr:major facilitator superfamily domain-containing protein [Mycena albidolilacea]
METDVFRPPKNRYDVHRAASTETVDSSDASHKDAKPAIVPLPPSTILTDGKLAVVFVAMMLPLLLTGLNQTILATALPRIASDFDSFSLQGWIATSFVLGKTVFLLFYGQALRIFPAKFFLMFAIVLFEIGSLVCSVAQNIPQLIAGRTVSGVGAAGICTTQIVTDYSPPGPRTALWPSLRFHLIGGGLTDHVTWRWCF